MTWQVIVRPAAEVDLINAAAWYELQREGLSGDFLKEVDKTIKSLETFPESYPIYYRNFRRIMTRRFPYKMFFLIEENRIVVFRILHAGREHSRHLQSI